MGLNQKHYSKDQLTNLMKDKWNQNDKKIIPEFKISSDNKLIIITMNTLNWDRYQTYENPDRWLHKKDNRLIEDDS